MSALRRKKYEHKRNMNTKDQQGMSAFKERIPQRNQATHGHRQEAQQL
jgi:hypothetical protein